MSVSQNNAVCPAILVGLEEIITQNQLENLSTPVGFAQSLVDPLNREPNSIVQTVDAGAGHPKTVRVKRKQPAAAGESQTTKDCNPGTEKPWFEDIFTVNQYRQKTVHMTEATVRTLCDAASSLKVIPGTKMIDHANPSNSGALSEMSQIVQDLMLELDGLRLDINRDLLNSASMHIGKWQDGTTEKSFNIYRSNDASGLPVGSPVLDGFNRFKREIKRTTLKGTPFLVGEGLFDLANSSLSYGCCNLGGTDFGQMNGNPGYKYYTDYQAGTVFANPDSMFAYLPGMMQFASYNEYVGSFGKIGVMDRGTMPDPFLPGISYDLRFLPNECGEYYDLFVELHFDLYAAPTNLFKSGDRRNGVNGVFKPTFAGL
jgi:hypothetical protein